MENLEHDPRAIALGSTMTEDLQGIKKLLTNLKAGSGPRVQDLGSYSRFYKLVLARCAWFVKAVARLGPADGKTAKVFKGKVIRGLPALEHIAETLRQRVAQKDPSLEQADAKDLNTFAWLLSPTQRETNKEIQAGIANIVHARGVHMKELENGGGAKSSGSAIVPVKKNSLLTVKTPSLSNTGAYRAQSNKGNAKKTGLETRKDELRQLYLKRGRAGP